MLYRDCLEIVAKRLLWFGVHAGSNLIFPDHLECWCCRVSRSLSSTKVSVHSSSDSAGGAGRVEEATGLRGLGLQGRRLQEMETKEAANPNPNPNLSPSPSPSPSQHPARGTMIRPVKKRIARAVALMPKYRLAVEVGREVVAVEVVAVEVVAVEVVAGRWWQGGRQGGGGSGGGGSGGGGSGGGGRRWWWRRGRPEGAAEMARR